jgi:glycosyltransferase involved in cell wall biosynthesis
MVKSNIKVVALTSGMNTPSSRFRVRQFIKPLSFVGVDVSEYTALVEKYSPVPWLGGNFRARYYFPIFIAWTLIKIFVRFVDIFRANKADVIWLERELIPGIVSLEPLLKKPFVFDVDDAIWTSKPFGSASVAKIASMAEIVVVGNEYLAEWFRKYAKNIEIIPTAIDTSRFVPVKKSLANDNKFVIGWTGSSENLSYVLEIEESLLQVLQKYPDIELHVISDKKPIFNKLPLRQVKYIAWTPENEASVLNNFDVGLMPLPDNEFSRGKCSFKMLQYMAAGLPVVVSPVGMNRELLGKGEIGFSAVSRADWFEALVWLYNNKNEGRMMGLNGREIVNRQYSQKVVCEKLEAIFRRVAKS